MFSKDEEILLDRKIATRIMGLTVVEDPVNYRGYAIKEAGRGGHDLPHFCTKIQEALKVVDQMRKSGHRWLINIDTEGYHLRRVVWVVHNGEKDEKTYTVDRPLGTAGEVEYLPRMICQAALNEQEKAFKDLADKEK